MPRSTRFPRYWVKVFDSKGNLVRKLFTAKKRRINALIRGFQTRIGSKYEVGVQYGYGVAADTGKREVFDNFGTYDTPEEALSAFGCFTSTEQENQMSRLLEEGD